MRTKLEWIIIVLAFHKISLKKDVSSSWDRDLNEEVYAQKTGMYLENVMSSNGFIESLAYTRTLLWLIIRFIEMSTCRRGALLWAIPFHSQCQVTTWWFLFPRPGVQDDRGMSGHDYVQSVNELNA